MGLLLISSFGLALACVAVGSEGALSRASITCLAVEQLLFYSAITYQYSRCIGYVQKMQESKTLTNDNYRQSFKSAIQKMRYQQLVMLITAFVEAGFFLYFIITLRLYWWVACLALGLDCFIYFFMVISFLPCCSRSRRRKQNSNAVGTAEGYDAYHGSSVARSTRKMVTSAKTDSMAESYHNNINGDVQPETSNTGMAAIKQDSAEDESSMAMAIHSNIEEHAVPDYSSSAVNDTFQSPTTGDE